MRVFLNEDTFDVTRYFSSSRSRTYEDGAVIDLEDFMRSVLILRKGTIRVSMISAGGVERLLFYGSPGCVFGDTVCFAGPPAEVFSGLRTVAIGTCELVFVRPSDFRVACVNDSAFAAVMLAQAYNKVASLLTQIRSAAFQDTQSQIAELIYAFFLENRRKVGSARSKALINMTHQTMASTTGRTRVSVTYALNRLQDSGAIRLHRSSIEVLNEQLLLRCMERDRNEAHVTSPRLLPRPFCAAADKPHHRNSGTTRTERPSMLLQESG